MIELLSTSCWCNRRKTSEAKATACSWRSHTHSRGEGLVWLCPRNVVLRNSWHIFTRNLMTKPNRARSRMLTTGVRRDVVHEVCSSSWERKPNLVGCGRASSSHGRSYVALLRHAQRLFLVKKASLRMLTKHSYVTSRNVIIGFPAS